LVSTDIATLTHYDAEAIAQLLGQYGEFNVVKRLPECNRDGKLQVDSNGTVTVTQLKQALEQLFDPKDDNIPGTALFFFAGHGHRVKKQDGQYEGFLATSESHTDLAKGKPGLSLQWLRELLQNSPVKEQVVWLDCCYSGELLNFEEINPAFRKGHNCCFIAASRRHEKAYQHSDGKHGMFTAALLEGLDHTRLNKGKVNSSDLISFIHDKKGWPQQPVCLVLGQSIELTRTRQDDNYALFKTREIEEKRDLPPATSMVDNTIDRESKNGLNKKITDKQKWPEEEELDEGKSTLIFNKVTKEEEPHTEREVLSAVLYPTREQKLDLVSVLLECSTMQDSNSRLAVLKQLPSKIFRNIRDASQSKIHVMNIVNTCLDYEDGLIKLVESLRFFEEDSLPMREVDNTLNQLGFNQKKSTPTATDDNTNPKIRRKDIEKRPKSEALEPDKLAVKPKCSHIEDLFTPILNFISERGEQHLDKKVPCEYLINEVADKCDVSHEELRDFLVNLANEGYIEIQYWNKPICKVFLRDKGRRQLSELTVTR